MANLKVLWENYKNREDVKELVKGWKTMAIVITVSAVIVIGGGIYSMTDMRSERFIKKSLYENFENTEPFFNYEIEVKDVSIDHEEEVAKVLFVLDRKKYFGYFDLVFANGTVESYQSRADTFNFLQMHILKEAFTN